MTADQWANEKLASPKRAAELAVSVRHTFLSKVRRVPESVTELWDELCMRAAPIAKMILATNNRHVIREELGTIQMLGRWVDHGMPAFVLTHGFMSSLILTSPRGVDADEIRFPFPTFFVQIPEPFWTMQFRNDKKELVEASVKSLWASTYVSHDGKPSLMLRIVAPPGPILWDRIWLPTPGENVHTWCSTDTTKYDSTPPPDPTGFFQEYLESDLYLVRAARRLLVNLALYVAECGRGQKRKGPHKPRVGKLDGEIVGALDPEVWVVGREVKLEPELVKAAQAWTTLQGRRGTGKEGWKIRARFTVRGHWRKLHSKHPPDQIVIDSLAGATAPRRTWVRPYWKGQGPRIGHLYKGKEKTR